MKLLKVSSAEVARPNQPAIPINITIGMMDMYEQIIFYVQEL